MNKIGTVKYAMSRKTCDASATNIMSAFGQVGTAI